MVEQPTLPSRWQVEAGLRAVVVLSPEGTSVDQAVYSLQRLPTEGLFRLEDLRTGLEILVAAGLINKRDDVLFATPEVVELAEADRLEATIAVLARLLTRKPPLWVHTAVGPDIVVHEFIPDSDTQLLGDLIPDLARREALLLAAADKVNATENVEVGDRGERHVVEECREALKRSAAPERAREVRRVSRISDALGYDVTSPHASDPRTRRLEVKTTRSTGAAFLCYLSRNEAMVGSSDPDWALVCCREHPDGSLTISGWCTFSDIADLLPVDSESVQGARGRWASVQLSLPSHYLRSGLPITDERDE